MRLSIVRHGKAERESGTGLDRDRELTARGERQAAWLGAEFAARRAKAPPAPALILTSPFARALATARAIQAAVGCDLRMERSLEVQEDFGEAMDLIHESAAPLAGDRFADLFVVGHNPQLEALVAHLMKKSEGVLPPLRTGEAVVFTASGPPVRSIKFEERLRLEEDD